MAATAPQRAQTEQTRKEQTIKVCIPRGEDQTTKRKKLQELHELIQKRMGGQVAAIQAFPSGDIQVVTKTKSAKKALIKDNGWMKVLAPNARTLKTTYSVLIHRFSLKAFNIENYEQTQKAITDQNQTYFPSLRIEKLILAPRTRCGIKEGQGKAHGSVIIEVPCRKMADKLIKHGIVFDSEVLYEELYCRKAELTMCFNCNGFCHVLHACNQKPKCSHCSKEHNTRDCSNREKTPKCPNCHRKNRAWQHVCPILQKKLDKTRATRASKPERYSEHQSHRNTVYTLIFQKNLDSRPLTIMQRVLSRKRVAKEPPLDNATIKNTVISRFFNFEGSQATPPISNTPTLDPSRHGTPDTEMTSDKP